MDKLRRYLQRLRLNASAILVALLIGALGTIFIPSSKAATTTSSLEAESGAITGTACKTPDVTASGGQAVRFGSASCASTNPLASLPMVPWEGGPQYWAQFSKAAAAGWTNPSFFPILVDSDPYSGDTEIQYDKSLGFTGYIGGLNQYTPWSLLQKYGMYYVGGKYTSNTDGAMPDSFPNLVGYRLGDETDGVYSNPQDGYNYLNSQIAADGSRSDGRFMYNNYTQQVVQAAYTPGATYVNDFTDAVSLDMYWFTIPDSSYTSHGAFVSSVNGPANPRSATSYGAMVRGLRQVDSADGKLQPIWTYIEDLDGGPPDANSFVRDIAPDELKGAAMSAIINECRGILWFNSAMPPNEPGGPIGNVVRSAEYNSSSNPDVVSDVTAMGQVNNQILRLAPVINTQSYQYSFGSNLETMLKWYDGSAYIFAMGANNTAPGNRTFTLPSGLANVSSVTVVDENRTIPVSGGAFTDNFAYEYSYHIYKITP